jgi:hypothetical protein
LYGFGDAAGVRKMPSSIAPEWHSDDLLLRMHFLRKMRSRDEKCLPKLRRGTSAAAKAEVNDSKYAVTFPRIGVSKQRSGPPGRGVSLLECFVVKAFMLFDKVRVV